jgi:integrase
MANVYERELKSGKTSWYCYFRVRGKRYRIKLDAQNKTQANALAQKLESDVINEQYDLVTKEILITLDSLSERYIEYVKQEKKSWDRDVLSLRNIVKMEIDGKIFGKHQISQIKTQHVKQYQIQRKGELDQKFNVKGVGDNERNYASINRELACLKHMFYLAMDWELVDKNPVASKSIRFYKEIRRNRILSTDEIDRLLSESKDHTYQIICIALNTGMRTSEILQLKWDDVDLANAVIHVKFTKNGIDRDIPINSFLKGVFETIPRLGEYVFMNTKTGKPITTIRKSFGHAVRRAKIDKFRFHDLRHTFSSYLAMNGVDEVTRAELLGHSKRSMTMSYSHSTWAKKKEAVEVMAKLSVHYLSTGDIVDNIE